MDFTASFNRFFGKGKEKEESIYNVRVKKIGSSDFIVHVKHVNAF
jgi:hypothetical protein